MLTARVTSGPRISMVASTPSTNTPSSVTSISRSATIRETSSASAGSMSRHSAANATLRYIAPVSRYSKPRRSASRRATVDLPDPAGPSMAITFIEERTLSERVENLEELREGLGDTIGVGDLDPGAARAEHREAHRHAVVVVGLDPRPVRLARDDGEAVDVLLGLDAAAPQLSDDRRDAVRFVPADEPDTGDRDG